MKLSFQPLSIGYSALNVDGYSKDPKEPSSLVRYYKYWNLTVFLLQYSMFNDYDWVNGLDNE